MSIYTFSALKTRLMYKLLYILIYISRNNVFLLRNDDLYSIYTYSNYIEFDQEFFLKKITKQTVYSILHNKLFTLNLKRKLETQ